jgi:hypothetical protein
MVAATNFNIAIAMFDASAPYTDDLDSAIIDVSGCVEG